MDLAYHINEAATNSFVRGTWASIIIPFGVGDAIEVDILQREAEILANSGVDGVYTCGTTGEFYNLNEEEFDLVSRIVAVACENAGVPYQIGVSHMSPQISLDRLRRASRIHSPHAWQVILPDWTPPTDDEAITFLKRMAEVADPARLVLYNPPNAKRQLSPDCYSRFKDAVPQIVGIKVDDGDEVWYEEMREHTRGLSVFVSGHRLATGISRGLAVGAYSNVACLNPRGAKRWNELMVTDLSAALALEERINRFLDDYIIPYLKQGYSDQAVDKLMVAAGGWTVENGVGVGTRLRWPYRSIPDADATRLAPILREQLQELFS
jgi:dihydrodipicolinate synthase/N-acetylneuraminate lyase